MACLVMALLQSIFPMSARIRDFDPTGAIIHDAATIGTLIADRIDDVADAALDAYFTLNPGANLLQGSAAVRANSLCGWEGRVLTFYILTGLCYQNPSAIVPAIKALAVTRVGAFGFSLGSFAVFTLIGTTEQPQGRDPRSARVSSDEESYLLTAVNRYLRVPIQPEQIVWTIAGVRPLDDDGSDNVSAITRDYRLDLQSEGTPPILNVIGGKITTYRRLAEAALDLLAQHLPAARSGSTRNAPLPGGDFEGRTVDAWFDDFARRHAGFERRTLMRLARRYGTRTARVIDGATSERDLGQDFGAGLCAREIAYLKSEEWADAAEDILWRRPKSGLHIAPEARASAADAIQGYVDKL